jgi:hypothetical protein
MSESLKQKLGLKDDEKVSALSGAKIFKMAMKKGLLKKKVTIVFGDRAIDEAGKLAIIRMLVDEANAKAIKDFLIILDKEINKS